MGQLDRDSAEVVNLLREAVTMSGMSQAGFARALGTSASRLSTYLTGDTRPLAAFLVRAQRLGRALGEAKARGLMSAPATASAMRGYFLAGETEWIWRMLLQGRDHLNAISHETDKPLRRLLLDAWEAEPGPIGAVEWDALFAAVVAHELESAGLEAPTWSHRLTLTKPWIPDHPFLTPDRVRKHTPEWLSRRNIFIPAKDLVTA